MILLILQALLVSGEYRGEIGFIIIDSVSPFIGLAGIWIFTIISIATWVYVIFIQENSIDDLFSFNLKLPKNILPFNNINNTKKQSKSKSKEKEKVIVKEVGDVAEITIIQNNQEKAKQSIVEDIIEADVSEYKEVAQEIVKQLPDEDIDLASKIKQALQFVNRKK